MKNLFFLFQNAFKYIIYNKFTSIVMFIALVLGFIFPLMAINDVNDLVKDEYVSKFIDASHVVIIEYSMKYKEEKEMYDAIDQGKEEGLFAEQAFCVSNGVIIYAKNESFASGVSGVSSEYLTLGTSELLEGTTFSEDEYNGTGEKICMLEHRSLLVRKGAKVGDKIEILGVTFRVIGIIRAPKIYGGIIIPYVESSELFSGIKKPMQYQIVLKEVEDQIPTSLAHRLFQGEEVISAQTGVQQEELYNDSIREINKIRIFRAMIVIVFASINIVLLSMGMIGKDQYGMAIRMALGASNKSVKIEVLMRNLILILITFFVSIFIYPGISGLVNGSNRYLHQVTILQVGVGGVIIISLISNTVLHFNFKNKNIALHLKK